MRFKTGKKYKRDHIYSIYYPSKPRPKGGNWDTGYVRIPEENELVVWINIGNPGRTGHDFDNRYDESNNTIVWYGKPRTHSGQPIFQGIINGKLRPQFFARWNLEPFWTYIGEGKYVSHKDAAKGKSSTGEEVPTIEVRLTCQSAMEVVNYTKEKELSESFVLERHLEDFIVHNWEKTKLGRNYKLVGNQLMTTTGPLDILALKNDESEYLVIELKKGRASDPAVGQILRYMAWVQKSKARSGQRVSGRIIGIREDEKLRMALSQVPNVEFLRYEVKFDLFEYGDVI